MLKAVIFDLDGTLLYTLADLCDSVNYALSSFGFPNITEEQTMAKIGNGVKNLMQQAAPKGTDDAVIDEMLVMFKAYYKDNMENKTVPYDGITDMLVKVRENGIKTAVLSNKYDAATKRLCDNLLPDLIDLPLGEKEGIPRKPATDGVTYILSQLECNADECVFVGDSGTDITTALNSGMMPVGVSWGYRSVDVLLKAGATIIASTPMELGRIICDM